jgi:hypothetical protein
LSGDLDVLQRLTKKKVVSVVDFPEKQIREKHNIISERAEHERAL